MESINNRFSKILREFRAEKGLTQEELAELSGLDYKYLQKLESNNPSSPTLATLEKIANGLNVSITAIIEKIENNKSM